MDNKSAASGQDLSISIPYNYEHFPLGAGEDDMQDYRDFAALCHWHPDFEFIYIKSGSVDYYVNGEHVHLGEGHGIFINNRRLHYVLIRDDAPCIYRSVFISPGIIARGSSLIASYYSRKFGSNNVDYIHLTPEVDWHVEIMRMMDDIYFKMQRVEDEPLPAVISALTMLDFTAGHLPDFYVEDNSNDYVTFVRMVQHIKNHYNEKMRVDIVAKNARISRSKAYLLFQKYAGTTPSNYLILFRIERSQYFLKDTDHTITEIAAMCGFQTSNYFSTAFLRHVGMTPLEFRKKFSKTNRLPT